MSRGAQKKIRTFLAEGPDDQTYLRVPSIPSVAWQPYPSPLGRLRAHSFASPSHDGFAFVEDSWAICLGCASRMSKCQATDTNNLGYVCRKCKRPAKIFLPAGLFLPSAKRG